MEGPVQPQLNLMDTAVMSEADLQKALYTQLAKQFAQQQQAIADQEALTKAAIEAQNVSVDLTPFYSALQSVPGLEGSGASYKPQKSDVVGVATEMAKEKRKAQDTYSDNMTNALKNMLSEKLQDRRHQQTLAQLSNADQNRTDRQVKDIAGQYDKISTAVNKFRESVAPVETALIPDTNGNIDYVSLMQILPKFARTMGEVGTLTDKDKADLLVKDLEMMVTKAGAVLGVGSKASISEKNQSIQAIRKQVDVMKNEISKSAIQKAEGIKAIYAAPKAQTKYLFDEGYQADAAHKQVLKGLGLLDLQEAKAAPTDDKAKAIQEKMNRLNAIEARLKEMEGK